jgi:hypothetical protein
VRQWKTSCRGFFPCSRGGNRQAFEALQGSVLVSYTRPLARGGISHSTAFAAELDQIEGLYEVSDDAAEAAAGNEALPAITMFCTGIGCPV